MRERENKKSREREGDMDEGCENGKRWREGEKGEGGQEG